MGTETRNHSYYGKTAVLIFLIDLFVFKQLIFAAGWFILDLVCCWLVEYFSYLQCGTGSLVEKLSFCQVVPCISQFLEEGLDFFILLQLITSFII